VVALNFIQYIDTVDWVTGRVFGLSKSASVILIIVSRDQRFHPTWNMPKRRLVEQKRILCARCSCICVFLIF